MFGDTFSNPSLSARDLYNQQFTQNKRLIGSLKSSYSSKTPVFHHFTLLKHELTSASGLHNGRAPPLLHPSPMLSSPRETCAQRCRNWKQPRFACQYERGAVFCHMPTASPQKLFEELFLFPKIRARYLQAPLLTERTAYISLLLSQGHSRKTGQIHGVDANQRNQVTALREPRMIQMSQVTEASSRWLQYL